ncbi:acyl-CoA/acyl-ACP dehydrogenase [Nocardioides sp. KIGAM211]|uniref:Acyl-CoA/acyl-ACP dehydrogenase n=1 Tax=Nocardioides luti TaxID=2761101 RepID=A0A7X0RD15_9ACTN|nr:acyl-CoA dehydrogenase family protein [Nocardioides luti]MBB6626016.1 acyl-CoA/acyl-ACP dehydrogenase [Nocardioides luti]
MRFELTDDQRDFGASLDRLLAGADTVAVARAWAADDTAPGLALWKRLAEQGVTSLAVPDSGATPVDLVVAFEALGRHAVPGPWVESAAYAPIALGEDISEQVVTAAVAPHVPYALDADVADRVLSVRDGALLDATAGERRTSVDRTRRLFEVAPGESAPAGDLVAAFDSAVLATSAQLLGCGERLLDDAVAYVKQRRQFGREIGSYQAVKHALADVRIALDFARPLVLGAALAGTTRTRDVAAAKVACADAAYLASRTALQVHGAVGYTAELDLSLWITKVRALVTAWGTPTHHRGVVLASLLDGGAA